MNNRIKELCEKYKIHYIEGRRYYEFDMTDTLPILNETTPYLFRYKNIEVCCSAWNKMTIAILSELEKISSKTEEELLSIKYDWTKTAIFSATPKTNYTPYRNLYLNTNHTSTHSMMNIQGLLKAYNIPLSECFFLIRRHFCVEPEEVRSAVREDTIDLFFKVLVDNGLNEEKARTVISNFKTINKYLTCVSPGYNDFFLFDDYNYFYGYKSSVLKYLVDKKYYSDKDAKYRTIAKCLDYLDDFYKYRQGYETWSSITEELGDDTDMSMEYEKIQKRLAIIKNNVQQAELHQVNNSRLPDNKGDGANEATDGI